MKKLGPKDFVRIAAMLGQGKTQKEAARHFGVSQSTICRAVKNARIKRNIEKTREILMEHYFHLAIAKQIAAIEKLPKHSGKSIGMNS